MIPMSLAEINEAIGGKPASIQSELFALKVSTDSREAQKDALFIALRGKTYDGHDYIAEAIQKGAVCAVTEHEEDLARGMPVIFVPCAYKALRDLARHHMNKMKIPVVAITGSHGKTIVKDMVASVLSTGYKTYKTEGNFNNEIGLPLCALRLDDSYQFAVFELGMRAPGEIRELTSIISPSIFIITSIGHSHIGELGSREAIFAAKTEMLEFCKPSDTIILNGDDDMLRSLAGKFNNIVFYGFNTYNDVRAKSINAESLYGVTAVITYDGVTFSVKIPLPGRHMAHNALAAAAVARALSVSPVSVKNGLTNLLPTKNRMEIANTVSGVTLIVDAYNASPASVKAALDVLKNSGTRKVAILGEMLELGDFAREFHLEIGKHAAKNGIDMILCVGELTRSIREGAGERAVFFASKEELASVISDYIREGDTVLIKGSRALGLESMVDVIENARL